MKANKGLKTTNIQSPVDLEFLRNITDHDSEFESDLLKIFIESSKNDVTKMENSIETGNNNDWYLSSHSFKGSAASIGAFTLAKTLEYAQFHKEDDKEDKLKTLADVKGKLEMVIDFLSKEFEQNS